MEIRDLDYCVCKCTNWAASFSFGLTGTLSHCSAPRCAPPDASIELGCLILEEGERLAHRASPACEPLGHELNLRHLEDPWLHPCNVEFLVHLIDHTTNQLERERPHEEELHLVDRESRGGGDVGKADDAVCGGADALEECLGEAHESDLLLEKIRVGEERRLRLKLRVILRNQHLVLVDISRVKGAEQQGEPRGLGLFEHADDGMLEQLAKVVEALADERRDAEVEGDGERLPRKGR